MTVPKTALVLALLLLAAAAAAQWLVSTGPYDVKPDTSLRYYLLWFPPHAVPMHLTFLNVTWWKPEAIWFRGTCPVHICRPDWCGYVPATIYVVQDGVRVVEPSKTPLGELVTSFVSRHIRRICAQGIAMVAPNRIIVLNYTTQIWISDIYCLHGNNWFWLRLLPYILRDELTVEGVEAVEFRDTSVYVRVPAAPPGDYVIPAGWYLDPRTKRVFRIPDEPNTIARLNSMIAQLNASLAETRGEVAKLSAENQRLKAQLEELNATRAQLETEVEAYRSQLETLRAQLAQLTAENQALRTQLASMNEALAKLNETYVSQTAQLRHQLETWIRAAWIGAALGATAGAAAATLALRRRK
jgi:regulator of replication initiation timing